MPPGELLQFLTIREAPSAASLLNAVIETATDAVCAMLLHRNDTTDLVVLDFSSGRSGFPPRQNPAKPCPTGRGSGAHGVRGRFLNVGRRASR